ncbi:translation initiation factor eIF2 assembly protein-like [Ornithodoros turicata]|uniref:translation initiation factor eIF2 assembly protein-like n=1 Tax=Ornithodoros turicata TaxID=34597 RepID=UPI0031399BA1
MKIGDVLNCSFPEWYGKFKKVTIKSLLIPLPKEFIDYLHSDGVVLPTGSSAPPSQGRDYDSDSEVDWDEADREENEAPSFPELQEQVSKAIRELGGRCFPKLNWSSPKDATWIAINNSPSCSSFEDICLLLKSSDFVGHDLTQPFVYCSDWQEDMKLENFFKHVLVLRKWEEIDPSTEFRCFVKNDVLIAITQRDHTSYYYHIEEQRNAIVQDIVSFFEEHIVHKFPDENYVFDVHRIRKDVVVLLDFNPFGSQTDSLLFDWDELEAFDARRRDLPELRYMTEDRGVQPSPYRHYGLPRDFVDLSSGEDARKLIDLLTLGKKGQEDSSNDEDDQTDAVS